METENLSLPTRNLNKNPTVSNGINRIPLYFITALSDLLSISPGVSIFADFNFSNGSLRFIAVLGLRCALINIIFCSSTDIAVSAPASMNPYAVLHGAALFSAFWDITQQFFAFQFAYSRGEHLQQRMSYLHRQMGQT